MVDHRPFIALAPVFGLAAYTAAHLVASRLIRGRGPYPALVLGAIVCLGTTVAITLVACRRDGVAGVDTLGFLAVNTVASLAFAFGYFNFVNLTIASVRIRMLEELADSGGWLPRAILLDRYGSGSVAGIRLERLVGGGHLVERNGRLHTGRLQFLLVARIFDGLRGIVFGATRAARLRHPPLPAVTRDTETP